MSTDIKRAPVETKTSRTEQKTDLFTKGERGGPQDTKTLRRLSIEMIGLAAAVVATIVMYVVFIVYPVAHPPLNEFLTTVFGRGNAAIWPIQLVWYASAVAMVGLAFWPRRLASQLICLLAAANFVWVGIVYFGVVDSDMGALDGVINLAWLWAAIFILEAILLLVAGLVRRDLVFAPRWNLSSVLGALFMLYALVAYPIIEMLGGQPLRHGLLRLRPAAVGTAPGAQVPVAAPPGVGPVRRPRQHRHGPHGGFPPDPGRRDHGGTDHLA